MKNIRKYFLCLLILLIVAGIYGLQLKNEGLKAGIIVLFAVLFFGSTLISWGIAFLIARRASKKLDENEKNEGEKEDEDEFN
ncbi:MAG: hypothetical protein Q4F63_06350 [Clostridia bacterium]|nr:hypothetical protein [Clostridia bacterium]